MRTFSLWLLTITLATQAGAEDQVSFNRDVKPILSDRCFKCHGPDSKNQKSEFRLDTAEYAYEDLGGYQGIAPGDLKDSEFHLRIHSTDPDDVMPPPESKMELTAEEKKILDTWIKEGAKYEKHWSFIPIPDEIAVPDAGEGWAKSEIDRFVAEKFKEVGMEPAKESPKEKWLRRASFDLTGLPPTIDELDAFLADQSADAYEKAVDRLLATDAYAERMTVEWLDVARYSDSYGYQRDDHRRVWPWRDWVLRSFRENKPYSEFITEQIAGDLIPNASEDQQLATTFNRLHGHCMEGGSVLEEYRCEYVADRVETVGTAFLGMTMNCTRCHDHKYDPLTAEDFYSMSSFFANIDESGLIAYFTEAAPTPAMPLPSDEQRVELEIAREGVSLAESKLHSTLAATEEEFQNWLLDHPKEAGTSDQEVHLAFEEMEKGTRVEAKGDSKKGKDMPVMVIENLANPEHRGETKPENVLVDGRLGKAIKVTGDDPLEVQAVGAYERHQPWSGAIWIKPSEIKPRINVFTRGKGADDSACMGYEFLLIDGKPTASLAHFWPGNAIRVQADYAVKPNEWTHLGVTYDGSSKASGLKIFINGEEAKVEIVRDHLTRTINEFRRIYDSSKVLGVVLGQRYRDAGMRNGLIDEFYFWSREVSPLEIAQTYDGKSLTDILAKDAVSLTKDEVTRLREHYLLAASPEVQSSRDSLMTARSEWNKVMDSIPAISVMRETAEPKIAHILDRGAYDAKGQVVRANTPTFLPPMDPSLPKNRLGFAQWLTASENPLTSRVTVNRYWQNIFGRGLVATSEDFGNQGTPPTHPELLDWLSRDFMNNGWDLKDLLKKMVLSATYRQSTEVTPEMRSKDPENFFLARSHTTRLTAEMIRDNALAASGLLVDKWGGPTVKPYQVAVSFKPIEPDKGEGLYRRSVYTWWKRNAAAPVLTTFGAPKRDVCTVKREVTTSPLQSLILLNDPQFVEASRVLGAKLCKIHGDDSKALVSDAYRRLTSRHPTSDEAAILNDLYKNQLETFQAEPESAAELLKVGEAPLDESVPAAHAAAATVLANTIMNLDESLIER